MASWDAIVVGLGGVGSSAAMHLAKQGVRVLGIDQYPPAHDRGSSHGKTRIIRQAYFEHPSYVPLLRRAYELWERLEADSRCKLFHRVGLVEMGPKDGIVIPGVLQSAQQYGLAIEHLHVSEVNRRWPGIGGRQDWQAVIEKNAGFLKVEDCVRAHLRLAMDAGANLMHEVAVRDWKIEGDGVKVTTDHGTERAGRLLIAGGPWSHLIIEELSVNLKVLLKQLYWFESDISGFDEPDGFPCFFHETPKGMFYGFPSLGDSAVKVARHSGGLVIDGPGDIVDQDEEDHRLVAAYVHEYLNGVSQRLVSRAKCYYTTTPDEHFVIDHLPGQPQVVMIAGLSGHGFKFTSVLGEVASQLLLNGQPPFDLDLFRFDRF